MPTRPLGRTVVAAALRAAADLFVLAGELLHLLADRVVAGADGLARPRPVTARPRRWALAAIALCIVLALTTALDRQALPDRPAPNLFAVAEAEAAPTSTGGRHRRGDGGREATATI